MKKMILKITAVSLFAAMLAFTPTTLRAQETTNAPAKHKRETMPFHGKLVSVDTNAMTLTVATRTFEITSETKITKAGKPATLADGMAGDMVGGSYKKSADGKLTATTVHFGPKPEADKKLKKKAATDAATSTNSVPN